MERERKRAVTLRSVQKNATETLMQLHDALCDKADAVFQKYNPCQRNEDGQCVGKGCCNGCRHLSDEGCTTKSLACKLWLCREALVGNNACAKELRSLKEIAHDFGLYGVRTSRDEVLKRFQKTYKRRKGDICRGPWQMPSLQQHG